MTKTERAMRRPLVNRTECVQFRQALEVYDRNNYNINNTKQTKQKHPSARRRDAVNHRPYICQP